MAHTYTSIYAHLVFSTKQRERLLRGDLGNQTLAYLGGITPPWAAGPSSLAGPPTTCMP